MKINHTFLGDNRIAVTAPGVNYTEEVELAFNKFLCDMDIKSYSYESHVVGINYITAVMIIE